MPLYDYRCDSCGEFEAWRAIAELNEPMHCPSCQEVAKRVFSPPNINLNVGSFSSQKGNAKEPTLIKRDREPEKPKHQTAQSGRPWMISHAPPRY
jgi:putative FmdB family regulatory protein